MHGLADRSTEILRSGWPIDSQIFSSRQQTANRRSGISQPAAELTATLINGGPINLSGPVFVTTVYAIARTETPCGDRIGYHRQRLGWEHCSVQQSSSTTPLYYMRHHEDDYIDRVA